MNITVSIVLYHNQEQELRQAIASCLASPLVTTLYLIDNSVNDHFCRLASDQRVQYIHTKKNIGFGLAHNLAIDRAVEADYHLVLNPDVRFDGEILAELGQFMESNPDIGLTMPKVLYPDGKVQRLCKLLPSPLNLFGRRFARAIPYFKRLDEQYELKRFQYDRLLDVPNLSGCFMFMRKTALDLIGGFDPRYFLYLEDVDLVRRMGHVSRTVFYPYVSIIHTYKKESYKGKNLMFIHIQSAIRYFMKWGWFNDRERRIRNQQILTNLEKYKSD